MVDASSARSAEVMARVTGTEDFYQILGVARSSDDDTIKKAYRKAALLLHPDKCQLAGANEAFQKVSTAFACLSASDTREYYDRTGCERGQQQVGEAQDPNEIFRTFFGDDFRRFDGGSGSQFRTFGGQTFVFNMGGGQGMQGRQGRREGGRDAGEVQENMLPWPLSTLASMIPMPAIFLLMILSFFWVVTWLLKNSFYFLPILLPPPRFKLPLGCLVWLALITGNIGV